MKLPVISLHDVTIRYAGGDTFADINFEIKENEHWAFTGENSPLINALMDAIVGNAIVSKGKIDFHFFNKVSLEKRTLYEKKTPHHFVTLLSPGQNFKNLSGVDESYYQQRYNSYDAENSITLEDYLCRIHTERNMSGWTLEKIINELHLSHLLHKHVIKLSNGETKRVGIATALLRNPVVLILQHPFTGLDASSRKEINELINTISASGISLIISTSAAEIPECITHVAAFTNENKIQTFSKKACQNYAMPVFKKPDIEKLKSLLSINPMPVFNTMVCMKNVSIKYDDKLILDNINWTIQQGERWALSGPNGTGKTTLLSLINGDNPQAFANDMILFDRKKGSGESIWDIKNKIGFFSAELYQYFPLETSCLHAVESGFYDTSGLFRPTNAHTASIAFRWMEIMGIAELSQKSLLKVSDNKRRLCLLARAMVKNPPLLILDEPCQGFNEYEQMFFKNLLDTICALTNLTLIYVSHYREEIPESVTHFFKLQNGRQVM
jgi:molybdate transport system ATP-binding protein